MRLPVPAAIDDLGNAKLVAVAERARAPRGSEREGPEGSQREETEEAAAVHSLGLGRLALRGAERKARCSARRPVRQPPPRRRSARWPAQAPNLPPFSPSPTIRP